MIDAKVRLEHSNKCLLCDKRIGMARAFDIHFDWLDCPFNCPNDYDHYVGLEYSKYIKGLVEKIATSSNTHWPFIPDGRR